MAQTTQRRGFWYGWVILVVLFVCYLLIVGFVGMGSYPVIMPAMLRERGWTTGETLLGATMATWLTIAISPFGGWIIDRWGGRITLFIFSLAAAATFGVMTKITELWQWLFLWGILRPPENRIGAGLAFFKVVNQWFNLRRGLALGLMITSGGLGAAVASPMVTWVVQSSGSWQWGWGALGVVQLVGTIVWVVFIRSKPSDIGSWPDGLPPEEAQRVREAALARQASGQYVIATTYRSPVNWTLGDSMRTRAFWLIPVMWVGYQGSYTTSVQHGVLQLTRAGRFSSMEAALSLSALNLTNASLRPFVGWLNDRIESRFIIMVGIAVGGIGIATLRIVALAPGNYFLLYAYGVLAGINLALCYPSLNIQIANYFGPGNYAIINATITGTVAGIVMGFYPAGGGFIYDLTGSYDLYFTIVNVIQVIGIVGSLLCTPPRPKEVTTLRPAA